MADVKEDSSTISNKLKRKRVECGKANPKLPSKQQKNKAMKVTAVHTPTVDIDIRLTEIRKLTDSKPLAAKILEIDTKYTDELMRMDYGDKITHVYNPVDYAYKSHTKYCSKFCKETATVLLIGENPGPFGGAQNGIPFGDIKSVTEWLQIREDVACPDNQHEKRPILGYEITRSEGSGSRLWGFVREHFKTADEFFNRCFIYNYCPMIFMNKTGGNVTPSQMQASVKKPLMEICDKALADIIQLFPNCKMIVGIGRFTEQRVKEVCGTLDFPYQQSYLLHPSPRNPAAARNWKSVALETFQDVGLISKDC